MSRSGCSTAFRKQKSEDRIMILYRYSPALYWPWLQAHEILLKNTFKTGLILL